MLELLKARFPDHENLHPGLDWAVVEQRLREAPGAVEVLRRMEESGGAPDTIGCDADTGKLIFRERRYDTVFIFHNGADFHYSVRGSGSIFSSERTMEIRT